MPDNVTRAEALGQAVPLGDQMALGSRRGGDTVNDSHTTPSLLDAIADTPATWTPTQKVVTGLQAIADTYTTDAEKLRESPDLLAKLGTFDAADLYRLVAAEVRKLARTGELE